MSETLKTGFVALLPYSAKAFIFVLSVKHGGHVGIMSLSALPSSWLSAASQLYL